LIPTPKIAIVHENDKFSTDVATAAEAMPKKRLRSCPLETIVQPPTLVPLSTKLRRLLPTHYGGGHFPDNHFCQAIVMRKG
jgi:hypothetical protein